MVDLTIGQAIAVARDVSFVAGVLITGFKVRGWFQPAVEFFRDAKEFMKASRAHMALMEQNASDLLNNHIKHIESSLEKMSNKDPE
jgi:hypothetical protein